MSRPAPPSSIPSSSAALTSFLPPSHKLLQLAATRRGARPVHATDLRTTKFYKTKLCPFVQNKRGGGRCSAGFDCGYAHAVEELRNAPDLQRTKWCSKVVSGLRCIDPKCGYAHCAEELQPSTDRQTLKTSLCVFWSRDPKLCLNGDKCRFAHGLDDLRLRPALAPRCPSPLISSGLTCKKPSFPSLLTTQDGITEDIAATCSTDIGNALTMLPTTESGFDVSSESTPLVPWDDSLYARCHSRMRTALQSCLLSDARASILQNEENLRKLLQGSASEGRHSACPLQPSVPPGTQRSRRGRGNEFEGDTNSLLSWLPSGSLKKVAGSENATTQIVGEGTLSAATTAELEGGDTSYPAFPLLPSQVSRSEEARGSNVQYRYKGEGATLYTPASNIVEPADSAQVTSARGHPFKSILRVSEQLDEKLACRLLSNGTSQPDRRLYGGAFVPSLQQLKTHSNEKASPVLEVSFPRIPAPSRAQCGTEEDKRTDMDQQPPSSHNFFHEGHPYRQISLLNCTSSFSYPEAANADERNALRLPQKGSHDSRRTLTHPSGLGFTIHQGKLRPALMATAGAQGKAESNPGVWADDSVAAFRVLDANSGSNPRQQIGSSTPQHAEIYRAQSARPDEKSAGSFQHTHVFPFVEHSTVLHRPRRIGTDWEELRSSALDTVTNPFTARHSPYDHALSEYISIDKETALLGCLAGLQATERRPKKSNGVLNAHAPPFFPRTLPAYTYCEQGGSVKPGKQGPSPESPVISTRRDRCGTLHADMVPTSRREEKGRREAVRTPSWQLELRVGKHQLPRKQPTTQRTHEVHCSSPSLRQDAFFQLNCLNANTAAQPTAFTCSGTKIGSKLGQKELLMRLCRANPSYECETPSGTLYGMERDSFLCSLSPRVSSVRRLSSYDLDTVETSDVSAFYDAPAASDQESAACCDEACEKRLLPGSQDHASCEHLMGFPGKVVGRKRSDCSEEHCIAASIPSLFNFRSRQEQPQDVLLTFPYAVLGDALSLKRRTAERDAARSAHVLPRKNTTNLVQQESDR